MTKQYITKNYIEQLRDSSIKTGVYFNTPKVIRRGVKYRKALTSTQKDIYEEFWDLAGKAAHKNQVDEKGRVYVECSYTRMAVALDIDPTTAKLNMNGTGKKGKYTELFDLGLIQIKKRKERETSEYYVMAPVYEGEDEQFLTKDITTSSHIADMEALKAKRAEYESNSKSKRQIQNEQLAEKRKDDSIADTAEFEITEREYQQKRADEIPDGIEIEEQKIKKPVQIISESAPEPKKIKVKPIRKYVEVRRNDITGYVGLFGINIYANKTKEEINLYAKFPDLTHEQIVVRLQKQRMEISNVDLTRQ